MLLTTRNVKGTHREHAWYVPLTISFINADYSFQKRQLANACR